jgi:hypothetical protein
MKPTAKPQNFITVNSLILVKTCKININ